MDLADITAVILTLNEAPNISRTLQMLEWAREVIVVDSFSTDETESIVRRFPNARFVQRAFDDHTNQWNFGLAQVKTTFVLSLDADYVLSEEFLRELRALATSNGVVAWFAGFRYCVFGRALRATLYPKRAVLFRRDSCHYEPDGHTQRLKIDGPSAELNGLIYHDDRKPLARWLVSQQSYAALEVNKLLGTPREQLSLRDRIRNRIVVAPILVFVYTLLGKGLVLDGWPGWYYVFQRTLAEIILSLHLLEARLLKR